MKNLYFVRHGESEFNKASVWTGSSDSPLTKLGKDQAMNVAKEILAKNLKFDLVISSPLIRAFDTAKIICEINNYPLDKVLIDPNTIERDFGTLEGDKNLIIELKYAEDESNIDHIDGVETVAHLQKRADKFYQYLKTLPQDNILVVGHGAFARGLSRSINNIPIGQRHIVLKNGELAKFI